MTLSLLNVEPSIKSAANWGVLEKQITYAAFPGLSGSVILRRTLMLKDLQLMFVGECCNIPMTVLSESFEDVLVLNAGELERLSGLVNRFLTKVDHLREGQCAKAAQAPRTAAQ